MVIVIVDWEIYCQRGNAPCLDFVCTSARKARNQRRVVKIGTTAHHRHRCQHVDARLVFHGDDGDDGDYGDDDGDDHEAR
jgi:hypothetical protein